MNNLYFKLPYIVGPLVIFYIAYHISENNLYRLLYVLLCSCVGITGATLINYFIDKRYK